MLDVRLPAFPEIECSTEDLYSAVSLLRSLLLTSVHTHQKTRSFLPIINHAFTPGEIKHIEQVRTTKTTKYVKTIEHAVQGCSQYS